MRIGYSIGYFYVKLFASYLSVLKRWGRSGAFELLTEEPRSLETGNPLQIQLGNEGRRIETVGAEVHTTVGLLVEWTERFLKVQ